jgi:hypothetical protein
MLGFVRTTMIVFMGIASAWGQTAPSASSNGGRQVTPGDRWTYEVKDEIAGAVKLTRTSMVTDISKAGITVRFDVAQTGRSGTILYDPSWNVLSDNSFKYTPNDGLGFQLPLTPNAQWKFAAEVVNSQNGAIFKRSGSSRVVGQERVTTKAGTFETFVVETHYVSRNINNPTQTRDFTMRSWFSPEINHWVRRNTVARQDGLLFRNDTIELTEFNRRK